MIRVGIHQPNFLPWLGYFDKISKSDVFIFLDDVQVIKTGGSWFNRVPVPGQKNGGAQWLTVPIRKPSGVQLIRDAEFVDSSGWWAPIQGTLRSTYSGHPYFREVMALLEEYASQCQSVHLADWNIGWITLLADKMGIPASRFVRSSSLNVGSQGTARLVELTRKVGGTTYLCGGGSSAYFENKLFHRVGVEVEFQSYTPKPYAQRGLTEFLPGLTCLDNLFNCGIDALSHFSKDGSVLAQ